MPNYVSQCHGGPVRNEETVDRIFAGDLDGLPNLSSRVKDSNGDWFPFNLGHIEWNQNLDRLYGSSQAPHSLICWWRGTAWWNTSTPRSRSTAGRNMGLSTRYSFLLFSTQASNSSFTGGRYEVGCQRWDDGRAHDHREDFLLNVIHVRQSYLRPFAWTS